MICTKTILMLIKQRKTSKKKKPLTAGLTVADTTDKILMPRDRTIAL